MAFCPNCGAQLSGNEAFCPSCASPVAAQPQQPVYQQPEQPTYQQPVYQQPEQPIYQQPVYQQPEQPTYQQPVYQQPEQPIYQQPVYQQPVYAQPVYQQTASQPTVQTGDKVKGFVGMGLGIVALVFAIIDFFMIFSVISFAPMAGALIVYVIFTIALAIPGMILSVKAIGNGFKSAPAKLGKIFSLVSLIIGGVSFLVSIIGLIAM